MILHSLVSKVNIFVDISAWILVTLFRKIFESLEISDSDLCMNMKCKICTVTWWLADMMIDDPFICLQSTTFFQKIYYHSIKGQVTIAASWEIYKGWSKSLNRSCTESVFTSDLTNKHLVTVSIRNFSCL